MSNAVRYISEPTHVREVSLRGAADLAYWKDRLIDEDLTLLEHDGRAQILIVAANMKFMGLRFTEVSFSVLVCGPKPDARQDAAFLVSAFNSSRLFAFCERTFFATPYQHADCRVSTSSPISIRLVIDDEGDFSAEMRPDTSPTTVVPSRTGQGAWEGPIFLPQKRRGSTNESYLFFGKMHGHTTSYPFVREEDVVSIIPSRQVDVLQAMIDSVFIGQEWIVRDDATHARSRTLKRSAVKLWES